MKTKHTLSPSQFPQELSQVITDGEKHGISDDLMLKGMISVGNLMGKFVKPDSPEEALMKEMWEIADDNEKTTIAALVLRLGKNHLNNRG